MHERRIAGWGSLVLAGALLLGCGGGDAPAGDEERAGAAAEPVAELTEAELEKGIGPVASVELGAIDPALVDRGEQIFRTKCFACHRLDERYVGPALRGVTERRAPEYVMNMMLNPQEMVERHPEARELLTQFMTPMPSQDLTEADARALLEYLRQATAEGAPAAAAEASAADGSGGG